MKKIIRYKLCVFFLIIGLGLGIFGCTILKPSESDSNFQKEVDKLLSILKEHSFYYENEEELYEGALRGIVAALDDPYSVYFNESEHKNFLSQLNASFAGLGITIGSKGYYPIITSVISNTPAEKAGFLPGDTIISIDGVDLKGKTLAEIPTMIKGDKGTLRNIVVNREDSTPIMINVTLDLVKSPTINSQIIEKNHQKIGYVEVTTFGEPTVKEFEQAMFNFKAQNITGLIIDVRNNPGGYLSTVASMLDYFIDSDIPFMYQQYKDNKKVPYYLKDGKTYNLDNIVVLINEASASASEIFAATMNELKGYQLIGKTTYGKGTVQVTEFINKEETKSIKYTTSIWLTSKGAWIHGNGVKPTIEIELNKFKGLGFIEYSDKLAFDHVDQEIKEMQLFLSCLGYVTRTDGYFNAQTSNAVYNFQNDFFGSEKATGIVNEETVYKLNIELIKYLNNLQNDDQYLKAIDYLMQN